MNGLGHAVGASIWPAEMFDEKKLFLEITTAICMMENWMVVRIAKWNSIYVVNQVDMKLFPHLLVSCIKRLQSSMANI